MSAPLTIHIHPTTDLAPRVLLPGDPGRAFRLAQVLLTTPKMFNHHRGLWGYTGVAADGEPLTIQSTGMGGPSCAIVVNELIDLGARRLLRIGTCGGLVRSLSLGALVVASEAIADDGTSRALSGDGLGTGLRASTEKRRGSESMLAALSAEAGDALVGPVASTDLFYDAQGLVDGWVGAGAVAVEMNAATLFTLARRRGVEGGCALLVSRMLVGDGRYIDADALHAAEARMGEVAVAALSASAL